MTNSQFDEMLLGLLSLREAYDFILQSDYNSALQNSRWSDEFRSLLKLRKQLFGDANLQISPKWLEMYPEYLVFDYWRFMETGVLPGYPETPEDVAACNRRDALTWDAFEEAFGGDC